MPKYRIGAGSGKTHYGIPDKPSSVKCGNWQEYTKHLDWSDDPALVTCRGCLKRIPMQTPQASTGDGKPQERLGNAGVPGPAAAAPYEIPTLDSYFAAGMPSKESK